MKCEIEVWESSDADECSVPIWIQNYEEIPYVPGIGESVYINGRTFEVVDIRHKFPDVGTEYTIQLWVSEYSNVLIHDKLDNCRRSAERGLRLAQGVGSDLVDIFQHILDEIHR
jgi:hypothetical protein